MIAIWLVMPAFLISMAYLSTDIINGVCVPWGSFSSVPVEKTLLLIAMFVNYLLPLALMIFCYFCIVYSLRTKVTACHQHGITQLQASRELLESTQEFIALSGDDFRRLKRRGVDPYGTGGHIWNAPQYFYNNISYFTIHAIFS